MLLSISNEFIPESISSRVIIIENNSFECKDYMANLVENNEENNLYHVIEYIGINEFGILSVCIYTNVNKSR